MKKVIKEMLLTFDYELFLGSRSGSIENCLIRPTDQLLHLLKKYNQKASFFIDTTYMMRLSEVKSQYQNASNDYDRICQQLINVAQDGHWLFHHLHPHWLDAHYMPQKNEWNLSNNKRFVFSSIDIIERDKIFHFSNEFLTKIYLEANVSKQPNGFRAGGLFIEPFTEFISYFKKYNIIHEFSVVPDTCREDYPFAYDFRGLKNNGSYSFYEKINEEKADGYFKEYPITLIEISGLAKLKNSFYYRLNSKNPHYQIFGDGISVSQNINKGNSKRKLTKMLKMKLPASIEFLNPGNISIYMRYINNNNYFHLLSHPKLLTPISIKMFDLFLKEVLKKHEIANLDF